MTSCQIRWGIGVGLWAAVLLVVASQVPLSADEAYYWCWSQALDWGYFDHPPAIAAWIRSGVELLGDTELGVRMPGILTAAAVLWAVLGWGVQDEDASLAALLLLTTPLLCLGVVLATPDVVLVAAWLGALLAWRHDRPARAGLFVGLAMLAKATGLLLLPALWLSSRRGGWRQAMVATGVALLVVLPHAVWLLQHQGLSWRYQLAREGLGGGGWGLLLLLGGQAAVVGPVLLGAGLVWGGRGPRDARWWSAALVVGFCVLSAVRGRSEPNWLAPAWAAVLWGMAESRGRLRRAAWVGGGLGALGSGLVLVHLFVPLWNLPKEPTQRLFGGPALGAAVEAWGTGVAVTERYQEASWIRFYGGMDATTLPGLGREDQFDTWRETLPEEAVYVRRTATTAPEVRSFYDSVGEGRVVQAHRGNRLVGSWQVYSLARPRYFDLP